MVTEEDVKKYQEIYKEEYGEEISTEEAHEQLIRLLNLLKTVIDYKSSKEKIL